MERLVITVPKYGLIYRDTEETDDYIITYLEHADPKAINIRWESTVDSPMSSPVLRLPSPNNSPYQVPMQLTPTVSGRIITSSPVVNNQNVGMRSPRSSPTMRASPTLNVSPFIRDSILRDSRGSPIMSGSPTLNVSPFMDPSLMPSRLATMVPPVTKVPARTCDGNTLIVDFDPRMRITNVGVWKNLFAQYGALNSVEIKSSGVYDNLFVIYDNVDDSNEAYNSLNGSLIDTESGVTLITIFR